MAGAGLNVAVTAAPGAAGEVAAPGGAGAAGAPGGKFALGSCAGAAGFASAGAAGLPVGGAPGADVCGGAGDCAREVSVNASEHRQAVSNVFIVEGVWWAVWFQYEFSLIADSLLASRAKLFTFLGRHFASAKVASVIRIICSGGM